MTSLLRNRVEEQTRNPETSDTLLKDFRSTLEARWRAFDSSVPQTAKIFQHEPYVLAKKQYEKSMSLLQTISSDKELRENPQIQHEIDTTI